MTPVFQTIHGPQGNCYEACVASLLDLPLESVPPLGGDHWTRSLFRWAKRIDKRVAFNPRRQEPPLGYAIGSQRVVDGSIHAVVYLDGELVHDPSPRPYSHQDNPVVLWTVISPIHEKSVRGVETCSVS